MISYVLVLYLISNWFFFNSTLFIFCKKFESTPSGHLGGEGISNLYSGSLGDTSRVLSCGFLFHKGLGIQDWEIEDILMGFVELFLV